MLKWYDFIDNRLYYRMDKNKKLVSLANPKMVEKILEYYARSKKKKDDLIFRYLKGTNLKDDEHIVARVKTVNRNLNRRLKIISKKPGIEKKLSTHIAGHSFGNISRGKD